MLVYKNNFLENIDRILNMHSIYKHLTRNLNFNKEDMSDILRSEIVYIISSLDRFIHDIVKFGMIEIFKGNRPPTPAFNNFKISLEQYNNIQNSSFPPPEKIFEDVIISTHKYQAFQEPDKISNALSLIWNENHKWHHIASELGIPEYDVKIKLKNLVIRRNQIVHESDIDLFTRSLLPIYENDVENGINFIKDLGLTIYNLVK